MGHEKTIKMKDIVLNIDLIIAVVCTTVLILITFFNAIFRYVLGKPFSWVDEVQMWSIIWTVSYGASAVFRHSKHISIDMIVDMFSKKIQTIIRIVVAILVVMVLGFMCYTSFLHVFQLYKTGRVTSVMSYPQWLVFSSVPIGFSLMLVSHISMTIKRFFGHEVERAE